MDIFGGGGGAGRIGVFTDRLERISRGVLLLASGVATVDFRTGEY